MRRPWFLPALPVGLGPKWRGTSDYSSKGTDLNKAFLLSDCLKLQNWCFHSAWSTVSSLQYNRHSWLHECSGSASLSFQRPEVTARPVISLSVLVNRPSTYLHLNEDSNWQSSIMHGLSVLLVYANYILGNRTRKHVEQLSNRLCYF